MSNQLYVLGAEMILKYLNLIEKKLEKFIPQNESKATYAKKINKTETKIDWSQKAKIRKAESPMEIIYHYYDIIKPKPKRRTRSKKKSEK